MFRTAEAEGAPVLKTNRIVVIGDGEEASLTAYMLSKNDAIAKYNYNIVLI